MRIVERYIREDAPEQVNISEECRERILATDATAYDIFDEARAEVLGVLEARLDKRLSKVGTCCGPFFLATQRSKEIDVEIAVVCCYKYNSRLSCPRRTTHVGHRPAVP